MPNVTQSYAFKDSTNFVGTAATVLVGSVLFTTNAMAADPAWYTDLNVALLAIGVMLGTVLGTIISIDLMPLAWDKIKKIVHR